jgi:hypothetical protein
MALLNTENNSEAPRVNAIAENVWLFYSFWTFCTAGLILNLTSFIVCSMNFTARNTIWFYNALLSAIHFALIAFGAAHYTPAFVTDFQHFESLEQISDLWCKWFNFVVAALVQLSMWVSVMITLDRMIRVSYPNKFNAYLNSKRFLTLIILAICVALGFVNSLYT